MHWFCRRDQSVFAITGGGPRVVVSTAAFHAGARGSVPGLGDLKETKMFLPHPRVKVSIVGSLRDREVACSASDRQGSKFESCVWRTVSSQSSHHPQEVLLAQFSLYVHKGGLKPDSFHFFFAITLYWIFLLCSCSRVTTNNYWTCLSMYHFTSPGSIHPCSASSLRCNNCHLCPTRYSFTPERNEAPEGDVPCPRTQHWYNNVPALTGEKNDISLEIMHPASLELARQAAANCYAVAIVPRPSHWISVFAVRYWTFCTKGQGAAAGGFLPFGIISGMLFSSM